MAPYLTSLRRFLLLVLAVPVVASAQTSLAVNANQPIRTVDERVFGINAATWDGNAGSTQTISLLQAAGVRAVRIPAGSGSDLYHWSGSHPNWESAFDSFSRLISSLNSQAFVTVNFGSGTPEEAAAWVAYSNASATLVGTGADVNIGVDANSADWKTAGYWAALRASSPLGTDDGKNYLRLGRSAPFGLKHWEVGNECYGSWENDTHTPQWDPVTYATVAKNFIGKMKAVDPTIKIGVVAETGEDNLDSKSPVHNVTNPRTNLSHHGWTPVMLNTLKTLSVTPDFLIYHRYDGAPGQESDAVLLQAAKTWPNDAANLRQMLSDYLTSGVGAGVELCVTENNSVYSNPGKQTTSLVNGLYMADSIGNVLQTEFNSLLWWDLRNGQDTTNNLSASLYGWRLYGDYGIMSSTNQLYPTYYAMKLLSNFTRGGDTVVSATSPNALLSIFAVKRADGSLSLLVINKDPTNTLSANIALTGFTPGSTATTYSYGKPQDTGQTDLATGSLSVSGSTFSASFGSYSATVISLNAAVVSIAPTITAQPGNQTVNAGGAAMFTATASGTPTPTLQWQRLPAGSGAWANVSEGGNYSGTTSTTLTVSNATAGMAGDQFRCVATNSAGSAASNAASLSVIVAPSNAVVSITVE